MIIQCDYMSGDLMGIKTDNVTIVCDVLPSVEFQLKQDISAIQKLHGAKWFNCKEQFKNGVLVDLAQTLRVYLKVQCCPASGVGHKIRVSFNYDTPEGLEFIMGVINKYVSIGWVGLLHNGRVTRLDVALDFKGVTPPQFLWASEHKYKKSATFSNDNSQNIETVYLGSEHSELNVAIYDRKAAKAAKGKDLLLPSTVPDFDVTRVEARLRPKMVNQIPLKDMQVMVDEALSLIHVLKARFLNKPAQERLITMQKLGYQRHLLKVSASPQLLNPDERSLVAKCLAKRSLFDLASLCPSPLDELHHAV